MPLTLLEKFLELKLVAHRANDGVLQHGIDAVVRTPVRSVSLRLELFEGDIGKR